MCIWTDSLNLLTVLLEISCFTWIPISQQIFLPSSPTGNRCDECPSGFYKNPGSPGLDCAPCPCNNNIDVTDPESCNRVTGECTKCLHNTHGANCQFCKPGYFGSALNQNCRSKQATVLQLHISTKKSLKKLGYRERLALGRTVKLKQMNGAKYENTKYISIQWSK